MDLLSHEMDRAFGVINTLWSENTIERESGKLHHNTLIPKTKNFTWANKGVFLDQLARANSLPEEVQHYLINFVSKNACNSYPEQILSSGPDNGSKQTVVATNSKEIKHFHRESWKQAANLVLFLYYKSILRNHVQDRWNSPKF